MTIKLEKGEDFDKIADYEKGKGRQFYEDAITKKYSSVQEAVDYLNGKKKEDDIVCSGLMISVRAILIDAKDELPIIIKQRYIAARRVFGSLDEQEHEIRCSGFNKFMKARYVEESTKDK